MDRFLLSRLTEYISDELGDNLYYRKLSERAPDEMQKKLLLEFSEDEKTHAEAFAKEIKRMTGKQYFLPSVNEPNIPDDYKTALRARVINESNDFRKYGNEYLNAPNSSLKNAFYKSRTDENVHALRILDMLNM